MTAPAGIVVGLTLAWGWRRGRLSTGVVWKAAVLGASMASATVAALCWDETTDEGFNLLVFAAMGAAAGAVTAVALGAFRATDRRGAGRSDRRRRSAPGVGSG